MVRTLSEQTVDAWTAIELARQGSRWIWLPTTNAGATSSGTHPGDVSTTISGRLVLIENKGIEAYRSIDLGPDYIAQRQLLTDLQDWGARVVLGSGAGGHDRPWYGWVFYGLPSGRRWRGDQYSLFGAWQRLVCPHRLSSTGRNVVALRRGVRAFRPCVHACPLCFRPASCSCVDIGTDLTLDRLSGLAALGLVGLPLDTAGRRILGLLQGGPGRKDSPQELGVLELLDRLSDWLRGDGDGQGGSGPVAAVLG